MKKIEVQAGGLKKKVRNRMRSVTKRVIAIGHALRHKGLEGEEKRKREYRQLVRLTRQILNDSRRVLEEVGTLPPRRRTEVQELCERLQTMPNRVRQVVPATPGANLRGHYPVAGKAADAGYCSHANEEGAHALGVKQVSIPNRNTRSQARRQLERQCWFKQGQKWRTGCEGRISVVKGRHGLVRCRYRGQDGMKRWVGLGVIADNLINMGRRLTPQMA